MELQNKESRPSTTYKLINTIRNKTLNCKDIVNFTAITAISFNLNTDPCEREHSPFIDPHHKQIITGDLTKGYSYREPRSTSFNKSFAEIQLTDTIKFQTWPAKLNIMLIILTRKKT